MQKLPCGRYGVSCVDSCPEPEKRNVDLSDPYNPIEICYRWHKGLQKKEAELTIRRFLIGRR